MNYLKKLREVFKEQILEEDNMIAIDTDWYDKEELNDELEKVFKQKED